VQPHQNVARLHQLRPAGVGVWQNVHNQSTPIRIVHVRMEYALAVWFHVLVVGPEHEPGGWDVHVHLCRDVQAWTRGDQQQHTTG